MKNVLFSALIVAALAAVSVVAFDKAVLVRFALNLTGFGKTSFIETPGTVSKAQSTDGWGLVGRSDDFIMPGLAMYCCENLFICGLYETDSEYLVGMRMCIDSTLLSSPTLDMVTQGYKNVTYTVGEESKTYYCTEYYFVSEASQSLTVAERASSRDYTKTLCENYLWVQEANGELRKIPASYDEFIQNTTFTQQACIPWMGRHFYDNMSASTECTAEALKKHFLLMHTGEMVGLGTMIWPYFKFPSNETDWCESPSTSDVKSIVTSGPDCLYDMVDTYGLRTCHIYFIATPRTSLTCIGQ